MLLGEQFNADHAEPNRVVIIPTADTFSPRDVSVMPRGERNGFLNPRPLLTRSIGADVHIWAGAPEQRDPSSQIDADFAQLDAMINTFLASLHGACAGLYQLSGGSSVTGQAVHARRGLRYVLQCTVAIPILDIAWPQVAITDCVETFRRERVTADIDIDMTDGVHPPETLVHFTTPEEP